MGSVPHTQYTQQAQSAVAVGIGPESPPRTGRPRSVVRWGSLWDFMCRAGLTDATFAARIGRTKRGIACWVRGERHPPLATIPRIAQALVMPDDPEGYVDEIAKALLADAPGVTP